LEILDLSKHCEDQNISVLAFALEESNEKHRNCGLILQLLAVILEAL
jgi:hypothetical protein